MGFTKEKLSKYHYHFLLSRNDNFLVFTRLNEFFSLLKKKSGISCLNGPTYQRIESISLSNITCCIEIEIRASDFYSLHTEKVFRQAYKNIRIFLRSTLLFYCQLHWNSILHHVEQIPFWYVRIFFFSHIENIYNYLIEAFWNIHNVGTLIY